MHYIHTYIQITKTLHRIFLKCQERSTEVLAACSYISKKIMTYKERKIKCTICCLFLQLYY